MAMIDNIKMKPKILASFLLVGLVPLIIIAILSLKEARDGMMEQAFDQLQAVQELKKLEVDRLFDRFKTDVMTLAHTTDLLVLYEELRAFHIREQVGPTDSYPKDHPEYHQINKRLGEYLENYIEQHDYYDVFLICTAHGHVMYTAAAESDLGENLSAGPLRDSVLAKLWNQVKQTGSFSMVDFELYAPSGNRPACFVGAPLHDKQGKMYGLVALQIPKGSIDAIMQTRVGMDETGETYLVGADKRMRSDSYLDPVGHSVEASLAGSVERNGVDTEASREALDGRRGDSGGDQSRRGGGADHCHAQSYRRGGGRHRRGRGPACLLAGREYRQPDCRDHRYSAADFAGRGGSEGGLPVRRRGRPAGRLLPRAGRLHQGDRRGGGSAGAGGSDGDGGAALGRGRAGG